MDGEENDDDDDDDVDAVKPRRRGKSGDVVDEAFRSVSGRTGVWQKILHAFDVSSTPVLKQRRASSAYNP